MVVRKATDAGVGARHLHQIPMWYQHLLSTNDGHELPKHRRVNVVWLEQKLKPRQRVTLKGDETMWTVDAVYDTGLEKPPIKTWHNNI